MNKEQITKEIENAAKEAGVCIGDQALRTIIDFALLMGCAPVAVEVTMESAGAPDPAKQAHPKKYIGTKIVHAAPALRIQEANGNVRVERMANQPVTMPTDTVDMGYEVNYEDGYTSWCPLDVFEAAYRETTGMNFGLALEAAKIDKRIARRGWNGRGMYVFLADMGEIHTDADLSEFEDQDVECGEMLVMRTAQGTLQPGWLASQADMLAEDWYIVDEE